MTERDGISVIIPVRDSPDTLIETLRSITVQTRKPLEILVVDDGSQLPVSVPSPSDCRIKIIRLPENRGPAKARNEGAGSASGSILLFVDADVLLDDTVIEKVWQDFVDHPDIVAVQGIYTADLPEDRGLVSRYQNHYYHFAFTSITSPDPAVCATFCFAVRRKVFERMGGFDISIRKPTVEDEAFGYRLCRSGFKILLDRDVQVTHLAQYTVPSLIRRKYTMSRHQVQSLLKGHRLPAMETDKGNRTHHALDTLAAVLLAPLIPLSAITGGFALMLTLLLYLGANARFWNYLISAEPPVHAVEMMMIGWLDHLSICGGLFRGTISHILQRIR